MEKTLRDIKIDAALELIMQKLTKRLNESRRHPRLTYIEQNIKRILEEPGDKPREVEVKIKCILPLLGGACQFLSSSATLIDKAFIAALEKEVKGLLR